MTTVDKRAPRCPWPPPIHLHEIPCRKGQFNDRRREWLQHTSDDIELFRADDPTTASDLAQLRERFPRLSPLWDAVGHQFWTESLGPGIHPRPARHG